MAVVEVQVRLQAWEQEAAAVLVEAACLNQEAPAPLEEVVLVQVVRVVQMVRVVEEEPLGEEEVAVAVVLDLLQFHKRFR